MERLVAGTRPKLLAVARRIGAPQDAEDSVQAAYHALLGRSEVPAAPIFPWLLTAVVRIAYRRKALARREVEIAKRLARPRGEETPLERASRADAGALLRRELETIPAKYRDPILLHHLEGLSVAETARLLDVAPSTVTTRLQRGRALLRSRLSPALLHPCLLLPWFLTDCGRALAGSAPLGVAMQAKTGLLLAGVGIAAGTLGLVVGASQVGEGGDAPRRADPSARHREALLMADLAARDDEIARLRGRIAVPAPQEAGESDTAAAANKAPRATAMGDGSALALAPAFRFDAAQARDAALRLGASEAALAIALQALSSLGNAADPTVQRDALAAFEGLGDERAKALVAALTAMRGDGFLGDWFPRLLKAARVAGEEHHLVALLKDGVTSAWLKQEIVRVADRIDSKVLQDYLVERIALEEDRYMFGNLALALGRLGETRAVPACRDRLGRGGDWRPFEPGILFAVGGMGGRDAETLLMEVLDRPDRVHAADAIRALAKINPAEARRRAQAFLDGLRVAQLSARDLEILQEHAGRGPP